MGLRALVLVVDDDSRSAHRLADMLEEDGYDVEVAASGNEALDRLSRPPRPAVLVTDVRLRQSDGGTVARFARERFEGIPVVVVTGYPQLAPRDLVPAPVVLTTPLVYPDLSALLERIGAGRA